MRQEFGIWFAHFLSARSPGRNLAAAVWASSTIDCETELRRAVLAEGWPWGGLTDATRLSELDSAARAGLSAAALAAQPGPGNTVLLLADADETAPVPAQRTTRLAFTGPLDAQFGVHPALTVPPDLQQVLFPGDGRHCHAVLDATAIPDVLEAAHDDRLPSKCLYRGELAQELRDEAPYAVTLTDGASLTRRLFTKGRRPAALWEVDYGFFCVTALPLDELVTHLRRFTAVPTASGKRLYLRFWMMPVLSAIARHPVPDPLIAEFLAPMRVIFRNRAMPDDWRVYALDAAEGKA